MPLAEIKENMATYINTTPSGTLLILQDVEAGGQMLVEIDRLVIGGKCRILVGVGSGRSGSMRCKKWGLVYVLFLGFLKLSKDPSFMATQDAINAYLR
ncbi:hypothetical protein WN55_03804 [Dufourea novaeangliae]|uniref:Uncharacterized protein n=1 Tax=Dufourea novaeangliae TaxID=178035 RepID=A0A154PM35_DUFNO|nr:hypothetical protein WN55_03804 [Dufourea novaeangliae]